MLRSLTLAALALSVITPAAFAACDISETKCALKDGKCNIKFRNVTADISGSSEGTDLTQRTSAQMIRVKALKDNGEKAGNALTIDSYASKTMNVDKKARKDFAKIRITSPALAGVDPVAAMAPAKSSMGFVLKTSPCGIISSAISAMAEKSEALQMQLSAKSHRQRTLGTMRSAIRPVLIACVSLLVAIPTASAACDISQTKCAVNGGKCNIHFRNRTGDKGGSDGSSNIEQTSAAQTVKVKARTGKDEGSKQVGNKLTLPAGTKKTMNLDRKAKMGFHEIRIYSQNHKDTRSIVMSCDVIKAVLNGNGRCKIFHGVRYNIHPAVNFYLGYKCDGGNIGGPTDARID